MRAALAVPSLLLALLVIPAVAQAHPLTDEARERFRSADFPGALEALSQAQRADDLTRADVIMLFELRALIHAALGEDTQADEALRALASLSPGHAFGREVPPDLVQRFRALGASLPGLISVEVGRQVHAGRVELSATVPNDVLDLVRHVRIAARVDGGPWTTAHDRLDLSADAGRRVEWYAEAVGPGGANVAGLGSEASPMQFTVGRDPLRDADGDDSSGPWVWVGVGVGAAALAALVTVLLLSSKTDPDTAVDGPHGFP